MYHLAMIEFLQVRTTKKENKFASLSRSEPYSSDVNRSIDHHHITLACTLSPSGNDVLRAC